MVAALRFLSITAGSVLLLTQLVSAGFPDDPSVVTYWGQNSKNGASTQKPLATYCDDNSDVLIMSFITQFNVGGLPAMNLANACETAFEGSQLLNCPDIGKDIKTCQSKGKKILLALGGASGAYGFTSDSQGETFANTLWDLFGKGSSDTRPFGDAVIDGFDLDIEGGGSTGYVAFVNQLRKNFAKDSSKDYYVTAAPQCPYPDAILGDVINSVGFDAVNVQFYNNYCSASSNSFNFDTWDTWAKQTSPNKKVKVMLGIPGSSTAAGSGYIPFDQLKPIVQKVASTYSSYGGVMVWDASQSYGNTDASPSFAAALGQLVHSSSSGGGNSGSTTTASASSKPTETSGPTSTGSNSVSTTASSTSSASPSSTSGSGSSGSCVSDGDACSTQGKYTCSGNSFGICNNGQWVVQSCPSGLTCFDTTDGGSIYCAQGTSSSDTCQVRDTKSLTPVSKAANAPRPYKSSKVSAQMAVVKASNETFDALINARKLDNKPFGTTVVVQMTMPPNMTLSAVSGGKVKQSGRTATLQIKNPRKKSMDIVFAIEGDVKGDVFAAPDASRIKFMS